MWSDKHILTPIIMAKELIFKLSGAEYNAAPVKLERKKIYGWTDIVATDKNGDVCGSAYLSHHRRQDELRRSVPHEL